MRKIAAGLRMRPPRTQPGRQRANVRKRWTPTSLLRCGTDPANQSARQLKHRGDSAASFRGGSDVQRDLVDSSGPNGRRGDSPRPNRSSQRTCPSPDCQTALATIGHCAILAGDPNNEEGEGSSRQSQHVRRHAAEDRAPAESGFSRAGRL